jgi:hypothetical protein
MPTCIEWTSGAPSSSSSAAAAASDRRSSKESGSREKGLHEDSSSRHRDDGLPARMRRSPGHHQRQYQHESNQQLVYTATPTGVEEVVDDTPQRCTASQSAMDSMTAWNTLTCNEGINLINWWVQGVGNDLYWPPNQKKGFTKESLVPGSLAYCPYLQTMGLYGIPSKGDEWSLWLDTVYGGDRMRYVSNIVYTNGNLDPWMPAGVAPVLGVDAASQRLEEGNTEEVLSLVIDMGGHHLDLFFPTEEDPQSVR